MERLKHIRPSKENEQQAIDYINEFYKYNSEINGVGGLHRYLNDYDSWLLKLEEDRNRIPTEDKVPTETFFLLRENDNKIVGMINIRLVLNEKLKKYDNYVKILLLKVDERYDGWKTSEVAVEITRLVQKVQKQHLEKQKDVLQDQLRDAETQSDDKLARKLLLEITKLNKEINSGKI